MLRQFLRRNGYYPGFCSQFRPRKSVLLGFDAHTRCFNSANGAVRPTSGGSGSLSNPWVAGDSNPAPVVLQANSQCRLGHRAEYGKEASDIPYGNLRISQVCKEIHRINPKILSPADRIRAFQYLVDFGLTCSEDGPCFLEDFTDVVRVICDIEEVYASKRLKNTRSFATLGNRLGSPLEEEVLRMGYGHYGPSEDLDAIQDHISKRPKIALRKHTLGAYNSSVSRMDAFKVPFSQSTVASYGMYLAAEAHSTGAFRYYTELAASCDTPPQFLQEILVSLRLWLYEESFSGWDGQRRRKEFEMLITGKEDTSDSYVRDNGRFTQMLADLSASATRSNYLSLRRLLGGANEVLQAWHEFKRHPQWGTIDLMNSATPFNAQLLHDVIENMVLAGDPEMAWKVVQEVNWNPDHVKNKTWSMLLDFPDQMPGLPNGIREVILAKYEEQVKKIEETLGIMWVGDEAGHHVYIDEPSPDLLVDDGED